MTTLVLLLASSMIFEDFSLGPLGEFPKGWTTRDPRYHSSCRVEEENGRRYLRISSKRSSLTIYREKGFSLKSSPRLRWRWRVHKHPTLSDERRKEAGDSAAGVYVVIEGGVFPKTLKYVWSRALPKGTEIVSPFSSRSKIRVLRSLEDPLGKWVEEEVDILPDYQKLFGGKPPARARGIAILTDSDNTKSEAQADYADFVIEE